MVNLPDLETASDEPLYNIGIVSRMTGNPHRHLTYLGAALWISRIHPHARWSSPVFRARGASPALGESPCG